MSNINIIISKENNSIETYNDFEMVFPDELWRLIKDFLIECKLIFS